MVYEIINVPSSQPLFEEKLVHSKTMECGFDCSDDPIQKQPEPPIFQDLITYVAPVVE